MKQLGHKMITINNVKERKTNNLVLFKFVNIYQEGSCECTLCIQGVSEKRKPKFAFKLLNNAITHD